MRGTAGYEQGCAVAQCLVSQIHLKRVAMKRCTTAFACDHTVPQYTRHDWGILLGTIRPWPKRVLGTWANFPVRCRCREA